jgi:hypothetical protein
MLNDEHDEEMGLQAAAEKVALQEQEQVGVVMDCDPYGSSQNPKALNKL